MKKSHLHGKCPPWFSACLGEEELTTFEPLLPVLGGAGVSVGVAYLNPAHRAALILQPGRTKRSRTPGFLGVPQGQGSGGQQGALLASVSLEPKALF